MKIQHVLEHRYKTSRDAFRAFNRDRNPVMSWAEFQEQLARHNIFASQPDVENLFSVFRVRRRGAIYHDEFVRYFEPARAGGDHNPFVSNEAFIKSRQRPQTAPVARTQTVVPEWIRTMDHPKGMDELVAGEAVEGAGKFGLADARTITRVQSQLRQRFKTTAAMFRKIDKDGDGKISIGEFASALRENGIGLPHKVLEDIQQLHDRDRDGYLTLNDLAVFMVDKDIAELAQIAERNRIALGDTISCEAEDGEPVADGKWWETHPLARENRVTPQLLNEIRQVIYRHRKNLREVFRKFDTDHDGVVSFNDFVQGIQDLQLGIPLHIVKKVVAALDEDSSGVLDYNEFVKAVSGSSRDEVHNAFRNERPVLKLWHSNRPMTAPTTRKPLIPASTMSADEPGHDLFQTLSESKRSYRSSWEQRMKHAIEAARAIDEQV